MRFDLRRSKKDANHDEIAEYAENLGLTVVQTFHLGVPCLDLLVAGEGLYGPFLLSVEIKTDTGSLTESQKKLFNQVDHKGTFVVVRNKRDLLECIKVYFKL